MLFFISLNILLAFWYIATHSEFETLYIFKPLNIHHFKFNICHTKILDSRVINSVHLSTC